jgi:exonuclease SbcC
MSSLSLLEKEQSASAGEFADVEKAHRAREIAPIAENSAHAQKRAKEAEALVFETQKALDEAAAAETACLQNLARSHEALSSAEAALEHAMPHIMLSRELALEIKNVTNLLHEKNAKLLDSEKNYTHWKNIYESACTEKEKLFAAEKTQNEKLDVYKKTIQESRTQCDELRQEIEALVVFAKTSDYGTARQKLLDGQPCPLCGALEHPFCEGLSAVQENEARYKALFARRKAAEDVLKKAEKEADGLDALKAARAAAIIELEGRIASADARCKGEKEAAALLTAEIAPLQSAAEGIQSRLDDALSVLPPAAKKSLELCETNLTQARNTAAARLQEAQKQAGQWKGKKEAYEAELKKKQEAAAAAAAEWAAAKESADAAFEMQGFEGYVQWKTYNWDVQKTRQIEEKKIRLQTDIAHVKLQAAAIDNEITSLNANAALPPDAEDFIQNKERLQKEIEEITAASGGMEQRLAENARQLERLEQRECEIAEQKNTYMRWKTMDDWIGGTDGYRFKEYVQAITFKNLVYNANKYLLDMTSGRYQMLTKKENTDLLPIVIDIHQGSIERNISNLSGGERFIMSLSLALGLSSLTSEGVRIDSIFLDEGFGTLDRSSLDVIINTLCRLHESSNKLIGIISHVEELKQRISSAIEVEQLGAGRSRLKGAGIGMDE